MAKMSDLIEIFIKELFEDNAGDIVEIQRNELASYFKCAPSQINYVLTTRFSLDKGYLIESQRGGGGFIKIVHIKTDRKDAFANVMQEIGDGITKLRADQMIEFLENQELITQREGKIMKAAISDRSIMAPVNLRNEMRASILKGMLLAAYDSEKEESEKE